MRTIEASAPYRVFLRVDGRDVSASITSATTLAQLLADDLRCFAVRVACDQGACGVCTVLLDGEAVSSCTVLAYRAAGKTVETATGFGPGDRQTALQQAFLDYHAFQCGFCTPGQIMLAEGLLRSNPAPTSAEVGRWMDANLCRCTGYSSIADAVLAAARKRNA